MMEAVRTSETSVDNHFTRQYIPEDNSEYYGKVFKALWQFIRNGSQTGPYIVRFQNPTAASMKMTAFWNTAPFSLVGVDQHFRGVQCLHHLRLHSAISQKALIFRFTHYSIISSNRFVGVLFLLTIYLKICKYYAAVVTILSSCMVRTGIHKHISRLRAVNPCTIYFSVLITFIPFRVRE
jgi:hypothetical protein